MGGEERRDRAGKAPRERSQEDQAMDELKEDVAEEVGVNPDAYGGDVPAKAWGALGGHMVKRLIAKGKRAVAQEDTRGPGPSQKGGPRGGEPV